MAKIVYISKYPPLEGGIASKTYWLTNALARSGHTIHIVTDAGIVDAHMTIPNAEHPPETPGIFIHRADQVVPWHIPNESHRAISLLDTALKVVTDEKPDLIVGGYLVPYGIVAFLLSRLTGIPFVLKHGGSDIHKFLLSDVWSHVLPQTLAEARQVITDYDSQHHIRRFTDRFNVLPPYVPDPSTFTSLPRPASDTITLALIGKANYHWRHKGWQKIVDLWDQFGEEFRFVVVSQGIGLEDFKAFLPKNLYNRIDWLPFVPPWDMPDLLRSIDGLLYFQDKLPFPMFSNTVLEALACGTPIITDSNNIIEGYRKHGIDFDKFKGDLPFFSLSDSKDIKYIITKLLGKDERRIPWDCAHTFSQYVSSIEERLFIGDWNKPGAGPLPTKSLLSS